MMNNKGETEIVRLGKEGILRPGQFAHSDTLVVLMVVADRFVRICRDYKMTVNRIPCPKQGYLLREQYSLSWI